MGKSWLRAVGALVGVVGAAVALASPGDLDPSFGGTGFVTTNFDWDDNNSYARAIVQQSDGKLVLAGLGYGRDGGFGLVRYDANGVLDEAFGDRGRVITIVQRPWVWFPFAERGAYGVVQQADGKLVAAGHALRDYQYQVVLARYDETGAFDPSFGDGGILALPIFSGALATGFAIQPDGKLVVAAQNVTSGHISVARLLEDGSFDPTFGVAGIATLALGNEDWPAALVVQDDGAIVVAGGYGVGGADWRIAIGRLDAEGTVDATFGVGGVVATALDANTNYERMALAVQADGRLVVAGRLTGGSTMPTAVLRFLPDGTPDAGFGSIGVVVTPIAAYAGAHGVLQDDQGRLVVVGWTGDLVVLRYLADGTLDATFGAGGLAAVHDVQFDGGLGLLQQPGGRLVIAGADQPRFAQMAAIALDGTGMLDASFGDGGRVSTSVAGSWDDLRAMLVQPDGKVVALGFSRGGATSGFFRLAMARWQSDGSLDAGFGDGGRAITALDDAHVEPAGLVRQASGRLVAGATVGMNSSDCALFRYDSDGTLDPTFGTAGILRTRIGDSCFASALLQQADGKLVQAGSSTLGTQSRTMLIRYAADGTLDVGFGVGGIAMMAGGFGSINAMAQQPDGKLLAAGTGTSYAAVARFDTTGQLDTTFGFGGIGSFSDPSASNPYAWSVFVQPDGKVVVAGDRAVARFTAAGMPDTSFAGDGVANGQITHRAVASQPDGAVVAVGASAPFFGQLAVARYTVSGALDPTFGTGGQVVTPSGATDGTGFAISLLTDGRVVAAGSSDADFVVARYFTQDTTTSTSSSSSSTTSSTTSSSTSTSSSSSSTSSSSSSSSSTTSSTTSSSTSSSTTTSSSSTSTSSTSTSTTLACSDTDGDGLCDADDPCTNVGGLRTATKAKMRASRLLAPGGDDVLSLSGVVTLPASPPIDPPARGLRILYADATGPIFDALVPAGAYDPTTRIGWTVRNGSFKFVDKTRTFHLGKVMLKANVAVPGQYKVIVKGRGGTYAPATLPVRLVLVVDHPSAANGQCGEWLFPAMPPAMPSCVLNGSASALKCR